MPPAGQAIEPRLSEARLRELFNVVNHAIQAPLGPDLGLASRQGLHHPELSGLVLRQRRISICATQAMKA